ncbi:MAG: S-layer homology domain-containing protein, partial [Firmicutes bacterium]|nr:S-layer homology domain-containing protein [Bacillota bacterium]
MKRKILFAIVLALCVSLIPAAVFADELLIAPAEAADGAAEDVDTEALPGIDQSDLIDYLDQLINPGPEPRILIWDSSSVYVMGNEGWEYVIAEKGEEPDWTQAVQPEEGGGVYFEGLKAAAEYVVYTRAVKTDEPSGGVIYQSSVMTSIDSVGIMGEAVVGKTLTAEVEPQGIEGLEIRWCYDDITEVEEYVYNHERTPIEGASGLSYVPTEADLGKYLSVVICKGDTELTTVDEIGPVIPGYEVYFLIDAADEEPFEVMYAGEDGRLESLPVPEKEGFTFEGWHGWEGESVTEETVFEWSSTVFAWWTDPEGKVSGGPVLTPELSFEDVAEDDYFYGPVVWAVENGVTEGTSDTTFSPYKDCTRAQMVTFLWRAAGCPAADPTTMFFDIDPDAYYVEALSWAFNNGIVEGVEPHTFAPNKTVTRGQAVTMLYRYAKASAEGSCPFADVAEGAYYYEPVIWAYENGITEGTSDTAFSPAKPCTRGQTVTFLHRLALSGEMPEPEEPQSQIPEDLGLIHEPEFGGIYLTKTIDEFNAMGFNYGDSVDIYFSSGY